MRAFLLILSLLFTLPAVAQPALVSTYSPPTSNTVLATTFVDWDSLTSSISPAGQYRAVFDNPTATLDKLEVHVTTLMPGKESHPIHRHVWEEILVVKEGTVEASINGKKQHAGPGSLIFFASNDPHNSRNVGTTPATYYVINFVTDFARTAPGKSAAEQSVSGSLASSVFDCDSLRQTATPTGSRVVCVSAPTLTFAALESHITTLNSGQSTATDIVDPNDEIVIVKSGTMEMKVNGISSRMKTGGVIYWAPNDKRTIRNIGTTPVSYQVIRVTPRRSPKDGAANGSMISTQ